MDCSLLSPVGGSWPRATAEKRSRARGLSRSAEARSPRVIEGAWQGTELERPAGGLGAFLCPAAQGRHNPNLLNPSGLASSHLPGLRDRGARNRSSSSGSQWGKNRVGLGIRRCAAMNKKVCPLPPPLGCLGEPTLPGNRSPPSSSVTLIQASSSWISALQPLLWQKPSKAGGGWSSIQSLP